MNVDGDLEIYKRDLKDGNLLPDRIEYQMLKGGHGVIKAYRFNWLRKALMKNDKL